VQDRDLRPARRVSVIYGTPNRVKRALGAQSRSSRAVAKRVRTLALGAVHAAEDGATLLDAVAHDVGPAMRAGRRKRLDRAFKTIKGVARSVHHDLESLVIIVSAGLALGHGDPRLAEVALCISISEHARWFRNADPANR